MPESESPRTVLRISLGILSILVLLYSILVAARPLLGASVVLGIFGAYLAWRLFGLAVRFVAAFERIADAMEARER